MSSVFIFIMQMALIYFLLFFSKFSQATFVVASFPILVTRFICSIILHMQMTGEVYQGINIFKFGLYRTTSWDRRAPITLVGFMQMTSCITTEIVNLMLICTLTDVNDIIMNFVALVAISKIDNVYAESREGTVV